MKNINKAYKIIQKLREKLNAYRRQNLKSNLQEFDSSEVFGTSKKILVPSFSENRFST